MSSTNYEPCLKQMLVYEGGYSNHPSDPGGVTLEGVIQTRYNEYRDWKKLPRQRLTPQMRGTPEWTRERNEIYRKYYWNAVSGDDLPYGVDLAVFDYGVNSGPGRALTHFKPYREYKPVPAIKALCARRLSFLRALGTWKVFGPGWGPRVANVEAIGVKMWLAFVNKGLPAEEQKKVVEGALKKEASGAADSAKKNAQAGSAAGGAAGGGVVADPTVITHFDWVSFGVIALAIGVAAFIGYRIYINLQRKKAYLDAAAA